MHNLSKYKISSTGSGYEELTKCTTDAATNSIITHVSNTDDMDGKIQVTKYCTGDSTARGLWYHHSYLREITPQKMRKN